MQLHHTPTCTACDDLVPGLSQRDKWQPAGRTSRRPHFCKQHPAILPNQPTVHGHLIKSASNSPLWMMPPFFSIWSLQWWCFFLDGLLLPQWRKERNIIHSLSAMYSLQHKSVRYFTCKTPSAKEQQRFQKNKQTEKHSLDTSMSSSSLNVTKTTTKKSERTISFLICPSCNSNVWLNWPMQEKKNN